MGSLSPIERDFHLKLIIKILGSMVEAGEKKSQEPPSAEELAQLERYEAMMAAVARDEDDEDDDYDLDDDCLDDNDELGALAK